MRTQPPETRDSPAGRPGDLKHFGELLQAFDELAGEREDVQLRGSAEPPPLGFAVRLQPAPTSAGVELSLWTDGARLTTWSGEGHHPLRGHDDRYVHLDLSEGFRWAAQEYGDARQLAQALLAWMQREIAGARGRPRLEVL